MIRCISNVPNCSATALATAGLPRCACNAEMAWGSVAEANRSAVARSISEYLDAGVQRSRLLQCLQDRDQIGRGRADRVQIADDVGDPRRLVQFDDFEPLFPGAD